MIYTRINLFQLWLITGIMLLLSASLYSQFAGGTGTSNDPYLLATAAQLDSVRNHLTAHFKQIADIDIGVAPYNTGEGWQPIGYRNGNDVQTFQGHLDGNGYVISRLFINRPSAADQGLFGYMYCGRITNVRLVHVDVTGGDRTGSLVGDLCGYGPIEFCMANGFVNGTDQFTGGLFGSTSQNAYIYYCQSSCTVTGVNGVGGLAGCAQMYVGIIRCKTTGPVYGSGYNVGGLVGCTTYEGLVQNCYTRGIVQGDQEVGGLIGYMSGQDISNCYSTGLVIYNSHGGGLIGYSNDGSVANSYWDFETSGVTTSYGGEGMTTDDMTYPYSDSTYVNWNFTNTWFDDVTDTINDGYPCLRSIQFTENEDEIKPVPEISINNYPNPFTGSTNIRFYLPKSSKTFLRVYNIKGHCVRSFAKTQYLKGENSLVWDGKNNSGEALPTGIYLCRIEFNGLRSLHKMTLLK